MPITLESFTFEYRSLPLTLNVDGSAIVTLRKGYTRDGVFTPIAEETYTASKEDVSSILDIKGSSSLTRRDDLSLALYQFCVSKGAEAGEIS